MPGYEDGTVPGYEFEHRRPARPGRAPGPAPGREGVAGAGSVGNGYGPPMADGYPAGTAPADERAEPPRFRYTPTVGQPIPAARPPYQRPEPAPVMPGFEFGGAPAPPQPPLQPPLQPPPPPPLRPPRPARPGWPGRPGPARSAQGPRSGPDGPRRQQAHTEWASLLRSLVPPPARRNWTKEVLARIELRGLALRLSVAVLAMIVVGVAVVVIVGAGSGNAGPTPTTSSLGFPPATLAGDQFAAADSDRGIDQSLGRVTSDGAEVVAVGSQTGARIARAQFFVSTNAGRSWTMGAVRDPDGGPPPPGHAARFVAGGDGAWVAIGPDSLWTSTDGRTWTLTSATGLPLQRGDQISVLKRTATGFIAAGTNVAGGNKTPVIFLSADGTSWQRLGAGQLRLPVSSGRALDIRYAAAVGRLILIAGDVATGASPAVAGGAWLSSDGGATWTSVVTPGGHGAQPGIDGLAATGAGFVIVKPAVALIAPAVDVYRSADGTAWTFEATLNVDPAMVNGGPEGAVIAGQQGRTLTAFVSANGGSWRQVRSLGSATAESVSGVTTAGTGAFVVTGTTSAGPDSRQPVLTVAGPRVAPVSVGARQIPGAFDPELAVNAVASADGTLVAAGSANGFPAVWTSTDGGNSWTRVASQALQDTRGLQQLRSVTHGSLGWLAVGGGPVSTRAGAAERPVVVGSVDATTWQAAAGETAFAARGLFPEQAAAGPDGYVIVGYQDAGGTKPAAWWSAGLTGWKRAAVQAAASSASPGTQMLAVTSVAAGPAAFVAVGFSGDAPAAWTSPDGRNWSQVNLPVPAGATRAVLQRVASNGRIVAAVGTMLTDAGLHVPFVARSSDGGASWTESALPVPSDMASVSALASAGGGFTATGTFGSTQGHQDVVVWTSANGSAWRAATPGGQGLTGPGIQAITALTASGSTLAGIGFTASPSGGQPVYWQAPIR
jgi:hypothetical protein